MLETSTLVQEARADETSANTRLWFFSLFSAMKQKFQYTRVKIRVLGQTLTLLLLSAGPP